MQRHPLDLVSLTAGLVFTAVAIIGLSGTLSLSVQDLRWIGPGLLVLFGVVLVATSVSRRPVTEPATGSTTEPSTESDV